MKNTIAIIPARGNSKRIPKKNIIDFESRPMICWTIEAAVQSKKFQHILVSTDDHEIKCISEDCGAEVPFMRENGNDDYTPVSEVSLKCLLKAEEFYGKKFENVVQLMANCPNRDSEDIKEALDNFEQHIYNFQISCFKYNFFNPWWAVKLNSENQPKNIFPDFFGKRSQDLEDLYCPSGAIWIANRDALIEEKTFYGIDHTFHEISWNSAVDIDTYSDLELALAGRKIKSIILKK